MGKARKKVKRSVTSKTVVRKKGERPERARMGPSDEPGASRVEVVEPKEELRGYLKQMMQIRAFEEKVFELLARDVLKGASHVYAGQEAVAVGACSEIGPDDYITSTHRGHGHCLARGGSLDRMLAELCGKATGYCRGRGGSMHIADVKAGNLGATGIVGGNIPVGTGAGLACKMNGRKQVTICFFGDGASNNGVFHESLNLAGVWGLPVVYVCENNMYGMSVPFAKACAIENVADRAPGYDMPGVIVDGMRVLEVKRAVRDGVERARKGDGPTLIEAKTYRFMGHMGGKEIFYGKGDEKVKDTYRSSEEVEKWKLRDPITMFEAKLVESGAMTKEDAARFDEEIKTELDEAVAFAEQSPMPAPEEALEDLFA